MKKIITIITVLLGFSSFSQSLKDYIEIAKTNNSKIKINTSNFNLANEKVNQVSYKNTNISAGVFALTPETRVGSQLFKVGISQQLPWLGELSAQKDNYKAKAEVAQFNIALSEKDLVFKVKQAYYKIYEELAKTEVLKENKLILKTYERMALAALSNNRATMSDVLRIRVQKNELHSKTFQNINSIEVLTKNFNRLLERDVNLSLNIPDSLNVLDILLTDKGFENHPLLQKITAKEHVYQTENKLISIDKKPKLDVGLDYIFVDGYSDINPNQNGKDVLMPKIELSIPIFNKKHKSQYKQVKIKQEMLQEELQAQRTNLDMALNQAKLDLDNAILIVVAAQKNKTEIQRAINVDLKAYETGILDYDKILRLQLQKIRFQLMEITAIEKAFITKAKIEYLTN